MEKVGSALGQEGVSLTPGPTEGLCQLQALLQVRQAPLHHSPVL